MAADLTVPLPRRSDAMVVMLQRWGGPVVGLLSFAILLARWPSVLIRPEFTYEDGQVFYLGALLHGLASVVEPYAGYLPLVSRLIALPTALVPTEGAPLVGGLLSLAVVAAVAVQVFRLPMRLE